jgi:hypothetical protein
MNFKKSTIKIGDIIYAKPQNAAPGVFANLMNVPDSDEQLIGAITKELEEGKKYLVEWSKGNDSFETIETSASVRAGMFNMKFYKEMLGMTLPQE